MTNLNQALLDIATNVVAGVIIIIVKYYIKKYYDDK